MAVGNCMLKLGISHLMALRMHDFTRQCLHRPVKDQDQAKR